MTRCFLFAGEASGDLHGSHLMRALRSSGVRGEFCGVGGPRMRQEGLECLLPMESFQVMGFSDVLRSLPRLGLLFYRVRNLILQSRPDCLILIDCPAFNLRLARALRQKGFRGKLVQYVCPSVWAHGKKRIETLAAYYDLMLVIFPFEKAYFAHTSLPVEYIGNPLQELIDAHPYQSEWRRELALPPQRELIALFPGSREGEIRRHAPLQLEAAAHMQRGFPHLAFALSCAHEELQGVLLDCVRKGSLRLGEGIFVVPPHFRYELMRTCRTALAKSGTVTLELALHGVPTVVHYELSLLNYLAAKYWLRLQLPHYCIVNILGQQTLFPECIGRNGSPAELALQLERLHADTSRRQFIRAACADIGRQLGHHSPSLSASRAIRELLQW